MQQRLVVPCQTDHGFIDGRIAVGIEFHGLTHDVGRLGTLARQQSHFVHGIQQFPVGGLEAVDLRNRSRHNDRHGVGHVVQLQGLGDGLLRGTANESNDAVCIDVF